MDQGRAAPERGASVAERKRADAGPRVRLDRNGRAVAAIGRRGRANAGVTLLELLLVMGILALLFGAGVGVLASSNNDGPRALSVLRSGLRSAQSSAQLERLPSALLVESGGTELVLSTPRVRGTWHLERRAGERSGTSENQPLGLRVGDPGEVPGFLGQGLDFTGGGGGMAFVAPIHESAAFELHDGFAIGIALRLADDVDAQIWRIADVAALEYERGGRLSAWVVPAAADDPTGRRRAGRVDIDLPAGSIEFDRWTQVQVVYDRFEFRVLVDGFPAGIVELRDPLPRLKGPLIVGGKPRPVQGIVDELVIGIYERSEPIALPAGMVWIGEQPLAARFEADGTLDRARHGRELNWEVETADGGRHSVSVSTYGAVQ